MFLVNCGIKIAKEAIQEINDIEGNVYTDLEIERIERYKNEILVLDEEIFDKMFYRKIENRREEKIGEYEFINFKPDKNQVLLKKSDYGMEISFHDFEPVSLNLKSFYTLYGIVTAKSFRTYRELREIATNGSGQEVSDDYIRQIIRRLSRDLTLLGNILLKRHLFYIQKQGGLWQLLSWRMGIWLVFFVGWRIFYLIRRVDKVNSTILIKVYLY